MINRFIADLKADEDQTMPSNTMDNDSGVLDLSRRRDSVETRKTPSPYNTSSSRESVSPRMSLEHPTSSPSPRSSSEHLSSAYGMMGYQSGDHGLPLPNHHFGLYYPYATAPSQPNPLTMQPSLNTLFHHPASAPNHIKEEDSPFSKYLHLSSTAIKAEPNDATSPALQSPAYSKFASCDGKTSRPFKAYPRDPLAMAATFTATDALLDSQKAEKYCAFRKRMLDQIHASNGGHPTVTNPKMRRNTILTANAQDNESNDGSDESQEQTPSEADSTGYGQNGKSLESGTNANNNNQGGLIRDDAYYERRRKNNAAAKKSRDRRRIKEDEIAVRAAFLEHENIELRIELASLKNQIAMMTAHGSR